MQKHRFVVTRSAFGALIFAAVAALSFGCAASPPEGDGTTDNGRGGGDDDGGSGRGGGGTGRADTGVSADAGATPDGGAETDSGVVDGTPCADDTVCPEGEMCIDGVCRSGCSSDADCTDGAICVDGVCVVLSCTDDAECDDENPCTIDLCNEGTCRRSNRIGDIADDVAGDCLKLSCVDGVPTEVPSDIDIPADDGIDCTVELCQDGVPFHSPNHDLCDDGDDSNGDEYCRPPDGCVNEPPDWLCEFDPDLSYTPSELCGDGQDNNGNGQADEGCGCDFGSTQRCYLGPPATRDVGGCLDGVQQCVNRAAPYWSDCTGGVLPGPEACDGKDNDCNGCTDDMPDCDSLLSCPTEDIARPLSWYDLDGAGILGTRGTSWEWSVVAPPNSATRGAENPTAERTRVYLDVSGDYLVTFTVIDDKGARQACSWVVSARGDGLRVEMRWNTFGSVDVDLHLHESGNTQDWCSDATCYYVNCQNGSSPPWGYPDSASDVCTASRCRNPRLDLDNISGYDPENINIDNPRDGETFRVMAHMYSGSQRTNPVVSIYCGGLLRGVFGEAPDELGLTQSGGGCGGQTWRVADVTMTVDPGTGATDCTVDVLTNSSGDWDVRVNDQSY